MNTSLSLPLCPSRSLSVCAIAYRNKKLINMRDALTSFAFQAEDRSFFCCSVLVFVIVPRWNGFGPRAQFAALTNLKNRRANHYLTLTLCRKIMRQNVKLTISTCKWAVHFQPRPAFWGGPTPSIGQVGASVSGRHCTQLISLKDRLTFGKLAWHQMRCSSIFHFIIEPLTRHQNWPNGEVTSPLCADWILQPF